VVIGMPFRALRFCTFAFSRQSLTRCAPLNKDLGTT
jgi:hypothetical protein